MLSYGGIKKDEIYKCQDCSFEVRVVSEYDRDHDEPCQDNQEQCCDFTCCGRPMVRK